MTDRDTATHEEVLRQLARLRTLPPGPDLLGLERVAAVAARLGNPERALPPVFHVAGTNGKGSTCAYLRAAAEAAGLKAHVFTTPHLVRFNERIRIAGTLVGDAELAGLLAEVVDAAGDIGPTFFEATVVAAFLAFARTPADLCVVEVGCGGLRDATNILPAPAVCGIAQLGLDHQAMLGPTLDAIAAEKAGIAKPGVALVTQHYPETIAHRIEEVAARAGAVFLPRGGRWDAAAFQERLHYRDEAGRLDLPLPRLPGTHQAMNAALAVAMLRHQGAVAISEAAIRAAMGWADWPARLQRLGPGPLTALLPDGSELWLDGGHNPSAARAVAAFFRGHVPAGARFHLILGLLENKDVDGMIRPFRNRVELLHAIPVEGHAHHGPEALAAAGRRQGIESRQDRGVDAALRWIAAHPEPGRADVVLVLGSLYVAGEMLRANAQLPS